MPREFARHLRVGAELKRVLNELLQDEVKDPRLRDVRVSEVDLSGDLVGSSRVDLQACKLEYSIVSPK